MPIIPPTTNPLDREYIGFAVVNVSFVHLLSEPGLSGISNGYFRRGTTVRIIERRRVIVRGRTEPWILVEGNYQRPGGSSQGWLEEAMVEIFDSEGRANTASKVLSR